MIRRRMSPHAHSAAGLVMPSTPYASISTARCSTRPMTITSGATSCRNTSRLHMPWTCTPRIGNRTAIRGAARHVELVLHRSLVAKSGHRHRCAASRSALPRGLVARRAGIPYSHARRRKEAAVADELPSRCSCRKTRADRRARLLRCVSHLPRIRVPEGECAVLARRRRSTWDSSRHAAFSSMTIPGCWRPHRRRRALGLRRPPLGYQGFAAGTPGSPRRGLRRRPVAVPGKGFGVGRNVDSRVAATALPTPTTLPRHRSPIDRCGDDRRRCCSCAGRHVRRHRRHPCPDAGRPGHRHRHRRNGASGAGRLPDPTPCARAASDRAPAIPGFTAATSILCEM